MKKNVLILGCTIFEDVKLVNNEYVINNRKLIKKLNDNYNIDNLSKGNLTSEKALKFVKCFANSRRYDLCFLALGEADILTNSLEQFKNNLLSIISILRKENIRPLLVGLPKESYNEDYEAIIADVSKKNKIEYISNIESNESNYVVKSDLQMRKAIREICM